METPFVNIHTHCPTGRGIEPDSVGIHPWDAAEGDPAAVEAQIGKVQIVGEIGLDYLHPDRKAQLRVFEQQLQLAETAGKPVVLHCVKAFEETMALLKRYRLRAVIFHGFIGSPEQAARAVTGGYYLSFGLRSFRSSRTVRALRSSPPERIFLETDDEPVAIESVYEQAAQLLGTPLEALKQIIYTNYLRIFE